MKAACRIALFLSAAISFALGLLGAAVTDDYAVDSSPDAAICPVVYRLDETEGARGYHYTFFGNAFFVNDQGYLLTVAHVLETFKSGGQPSILVARPDSPPQLLPLTTIAADAGHDIAILRASPNPFSGHSRVSFLPLASDAAIPGQSVLALSRHAARMPDAQSFQLPIEDRSAGIVLSIEETKLEKFALPAEVLLLSHPVVLGQSGSPVLATESGAVVGLIEGRWVRGGSVALARREEQVAEPPGAAIPVRYAISLLEQNRIAYHSAQRNETREAATAKK
ncbi:MAG TPA: serine protease [Candidatus Acidoferrum sp.]